MILGICGPGGQLLARPLWRRRGHDRRLGSGPSFSSNLMEMCHIMKYYQ